MRAATSALLGALAVVAGWVAWSTLAPGDRTDVAPSDTVAVAVATAASASASVAAPGPAAAPSARLVARENSPAPRAAASPPAPPAPPLPDGIVMAHGMPTAVRAPVSNAASPTVAPVAVTVPAGVRPDDTAVDRAGMVAVTRNAAEPADSGAPPANPLQAAVADRAP